MLTFTDKKHWAKACIARGAVNHIAEITTYDDLGQQHMQEYAVEKGNINLIGTWHPVSKRGYVYAAPLRQFSTTGRKFITEKLSQYT